MCTAMTKHVDVHVNVGRYGKKAVVKRGCKEEVHCYCLFHIVIREEQEKENIGSCNERVSSTADLTS